MSKKLKEIVILHSNDIHGRFEGERDENGKLCHSLAHNYKIGDRNGSEKEN